MYYKIVAVESDGRLVSCCRNSLFPDLYRTVYTPGRAVEPVVHGTKLFVFGDRYSAGGWLHSMVESSPGSVFELWSCMCSPDAQRIERAPGITEINRYWTGGHYTCQRLTLQGAYLVSAVTLTEMVVRKAVADYTRVD